MKEDARLFDGSNYFRPEKFDELCVEIEKGGRVKLYINCIGFTRAHNEGHTYKDAVVKKYGDRVKVTTIDHPYYDSFIFELVA